jgi:hypothetical protein
MMIGLLVASAIGVLTTSANAGFIGFSIKGYSELTVVVNIDEVKNLKFDQEISITGTLNFIEVICLNPQNFNLAPANAGAREAEATQAVTSADLTDRQGNKATVTILFAGEVLEAAEETPGLCNNLWTVVDGSAAAKSLSLTLSQSRLSNQGLVIVDTVNVICTFDPLLRDAAGLPLHDQEATCNVVN